MVGSKQKSLTVSVPQRIGLKQAFINFYKNYFRFMGTATRPEYWYVMSVFVVMVAVLRVLARAGIFAGYDTIVITMIALFVLVSFIPFVSLVMRRWNDAGVPRWGWGALLLVIVLPELIYKNFIHAAYMADVVNVSEYIMILVMLFVIPILPGAASNGKKAL